MRKQSTALIVGAANKYLTLYNDMCAAITNCHAVDECKDIADKSAGLAAYYAQIKDTQTERMFYQVRLRAWRRMGELFSAADLSDCARARTHKSRPIARFD